MIEIGMITAPREIPTLERSILSLREAGFQQNLHVFAEPGDYPLSDTNITLHLNPTPLGCFKNFHHALSSLISQTTRPYVLVLLDDMLYAKDLYPYLVKTLKSHPGPFGYFALISIQYDVARLQNMQLGWNPCTLGKNSWGGLYVMPTEIAGHLITYPAYLNHLHHYEKNQQIDACVSECFKQLGLPMYIHVPSLSDHIGETSTIGHGELTDLRKGYQFSPDNCQGLL